MIHKSDSKYACLVKIIAIWKFRKNHVNIIAKCIERVEVMGIDSIDCTNNEYYIENNLIS